MHNSISCKEGMNQRNQTPEPPAKPVSESAESPPVQVGYLYKDTINRHLHAVLDLTRNLLNCVEEKEE